MKKQIFVTAPVLLMMMVLSYAATAAAAPRSARNAAKAEATVQQAAQAQAEEERQYTVEELKVMAEDCRKSKDAEGLVNVLQKLAAREKRFDIRLELGETFMSLERYPEAIAVLKEASSLIPSDEAPNRLLAKIYAVQGVDSLRAFHLVKAAHLAQRNWENQFNLAVYYISAGKIVNAEKLLVKTMDLNPSFAPAKFEYARLMLGKNDLESAFRKFDEAVLIEPQNAIYLAYYGYTANISGRHSIANENIAAALKGAPKNAEVLTLAARVKLNNGNSSAAEQYAREALRCSPSDMRALEVLGDVFAAEFKYKEATGAYMNVWQNAGYREDLVYKLGTILALDGKFKEAKSFFEAIALKNPNNGEMLYKLTEVYCELGDMKQANGLLMLNRLGDSKDNLAWHKASQGRIHEAKNENDLALTAYSAALMIDESNAHVNAGMGRMLLKQGDLDNAMEFLKTANGLDPNNVQTLAAMAKIHEEKGEFNEAVGVYGQIIARNPKLTDVCIAAARIKEEQGDIKAAISYLNKALTYIPKDANLLFQLGRLYQTTKQYDLAINTYQTSVGSKASVQTVEALRMIGEIYYTKLTNEKKALEFFKKYVKAGGKDGNVDFLIKRMTDKKG